MKSYQLVLALPFMLAFGMAAHAVLSRAVKTVLWAWSPLASGEPEAATYERRVYHTADLPMMQLAAAAALAGLPWWIGLSRGGGLWWLVGVLAVAAVVAWDVLRWERVAVSGHNLWFQRGFRGRVHQVALENVRDVSVEETAAHGFTLRHGRDNRLVRLNVRLHDKRLIALPKTDADGGLDAVESVANHLRMRLQQLHDQELARTRRLARDLPPVREPGPADAAVNADAPAEQDQDLLGALQRVRHGAALKRPTP